MEPNLNQLIDQATPLPWRLLGWENSNIIAPGGRVIIVADKTERRWKANALLAKHAVNVLPELVAALRTMQSRLDAVMINGCCMKYADAVGGEAGVLIADLEMIQDALAHANRP